jgi:plasmid stabilization system protein ParE
VKVLISQRAEDDLARIYGYIVGRNPDAAERFRSEAERALALLGKHPELGPRPGWETCHTRLRFWIISGFHNYLIYYEQREDAVSVERVLDGRRDVRRIMQERIEDPGMEH